MFVIIKFVNVKNGKVIHVNILMYVYIFEACRVPGRKLLLPPDVIYLYSLKSQLLLFKGKSPNCYSLISEPLRY